MSLSYRAISVCIASTCTMATVLWMVATKPWQSPEQVLEQFYAHSAPEVALMDPLILRGKAVISIVISKVGTPDMPRRRYAIGFLGNERSIEAVPVLAKILEEEHERDHVRADALIAIYQIDRQRGLALAKAYASREDGLGRMSQQILRAPSAAANHRSYIDALLGRTN